MPKRKPARSSPVLREPSAPHGGEILLYQTPDGSVKLDVRLEQETIWLNLNQLAALFERDKSVISRHLRNIYKEGELEREATVAFFATVQDEGGRQVTRQVEYYNLDAIISVGYRVNSKRGTQFRIWATQVLREHILKGYTVNARRLQELRQTIRLVSTLADQHTLSSDEAAGLLRVVRDYAFALELIDDYDHGRIPLPAVDREYWVDLAQPAAFLRASQPKVAEALDLEHDSPMRCKFLARLPLATSKRRRSMRRTASPSPAGCILPIWEFPVSLCNSSTSLRRGILPPCLAKSSNRVRWFGVESERNW